MSKITRRQSIWTAIGAIFAPAAVSTAADSPFPPPPTSYEAEMPSVKAVNPVDQLLWRQKRIAQLTKIANGELTESQLDNLQNNNPMINPTLNIDSLKSPSNSYKEIMRQNCYKKQQKDNMIKDAARRLKRLLAGKHEYNDDPPE